MIGDLDGHTYPHIDVTRIGDSPFNLHPEGPRCPHCGSSSPHIERVRFPGFVVIHCIICGWAATRNRIDKRTQSFNEYNGPRPVGPTSENNTGLCDDCGKIPRAGRSRYCTPCKKKRSRHAVLRYQARLRGEEIPDMRTIEYRNARLVDDLIDEMSHYIVGIAPSEA